MRHLAFLLVISFVLTSCSKKGKRATSNSFDKGKKLAEVKSKRLEEASGLAASASHKGHFWTINDSGNKAEVLMVNDKLEILITCLLPVKNRDWEDIAVGPGPVEGRSYIYVAEIGDNLAMYPYKHIYRFKEPIFGPSEKVSITDFDTITFKLEDGVKDTEALMIDPKTKNLYVVSKRENPVYVYELTYPYSTRDTLTAKKTVSIPHSQIVAADFSSDGKEVLMKNYENVFYWSLGEEPLLEALGKTPAIVEYDKEPQGEAITFAKDGSGFYTISEMVKGEKSYLWFYPRK